MGAQLSPEHWNKPIAVRRKSRVKFFLHKTSTYKNFLKKQENLNLLKSSILLRFQIAKVFSSVQSLSCVWLFATPWTAACQASLSITNSRSLLKLMSIESVMPSNHLILCRPLHLLPSIFTVLNIFVYSLFKVCEHNLMNSCFKTSFG